VPGAVLTCDKGVEHIMIDFLGEPMFGVETYSLSNLCHFDSLGACFMTWLQRGVARSFAPPNWDCVSA